MYSSNITELYFVFVQSGSSIIYCFIIWQLLTMQKEMQKQMTMMVSVPVTKEGRRLEASLGKSMEKAVKIHSDILWTRFQEENAKNEKVSRDRLQHITGLISNFMNKDLPAILEKTVKKEIASVGPAVVRAMSPAVEKIISSTIMESFQVCALSLCLVEIRMNSMKLVLLGSKWNFMS